MLQKDCLLCNLKLIIENIGKSTKVKALNMKFIHKLEMKKGFALNKLYKVERLLYLIENFNKNKSLKKFKTYQALTRKRRFENKKIFQNGFKIFR